MRLVSPGLVSFTLGFPRNGSARGTPCRAREHAARCPRIILYGMTAHAYVTAFGMRLPGSYWPACAPARSDPGAAPRSRVVAIVERYGRSVAMLACEHLAPWARFDGPGPGPALGDALPCWPCLDRQRGVRP